MFVRNMALRHRRWGIVLAFGTVLLGLFLYQSAQSRRVNRVRNAIESQGAHATVEFDGPKWLDDLLWRVPALHHRLETRFRSIHYGPERRTESLAPIDLSYLPDVPDLESLSLEQAAVTDADLVFIGELRKLERLTVDAPLVTANGAQHLAPLAEMQELCLENTQVNDEGLRILAGMPRLKRLLLHGSYELTGEGLKYLPGDCRLEDLWLHDTKFDHGLEYIDLSGLKRIIIDSPRITDDVIGPLREARQLEHLWADDTAITDDGLLHIARLPKLKTLRLRGSQVTDVGLEHLSELKTLEGLFVTGTKVTEAGARRLVERISTLHVGIGPSQHEMEWVRGAAVPE